MQTHSKVSMSQWMQISLGLITFTFKQQVHDCITSLYMTSISQSTICHKGYKNTEDFECENFWEDWKKNHLKIFLQRTMSV